MTDTLPETAPVTGRHALDLIERGNIQNRMRRLFHQLRPQKSTDFSLLEKLVDCVREPEIVDVVKPLAEKLQAQHDEAVAKHDAFYLSIDFDRIALCALIGRVHNRASMTRDTEVRDRFTASIAINWDKEPRESVIHFLREALTAGVLPNEISEWPDTVILMLYPRMCAHIICGSLGYASADKAARMLGAAHDFHPAYNEWAYDTAIRSYEKTVESGRTCGRFEGHNGECRYRKWGDRDDPDWDTFRLENPDKDLPLCCGAREKIPNPKDFKQHEIDSTRKLIKNCVASPTWSPRRRRHSGYMADYRNGLAVVAREIIGRTPEPNFAAWF